MDLGISEELKEVREKIRVFADEKVLPLEQEYMIEIGVGDRWSHTPRQEEILNGLRSTKTGFLELFPTRKSGGGWCIQP